MGHADVLTVQTQELGLGSLFWATRDAVIVVDPRNSRVILWNSSAERLFGRSMADATGMPLDTLLPDLAQTPEWLPYAGLELGGVAPPAAGEAIRTVAKTSDRQRLRVEVNIGVHYGADGSLPYLLLSIRDVTASAWKEGLNAGQRDLLETIARGDPLSQVLDSLARFIEKQSNSGVLCSVLTLDDEGVLHHGAAPSLPESFNQAIDGLTAGASAGSCGTAAYRREPVVSSDIEHDPVWENYRDLALSHGLRACWSTPIMSKTGQVLGTLATYYRRPAEPSATDVQLVEMATNLAGIAMERARAKEVHEALVREQARRAEAEKAERRLAFLAEASTILGGSLDCNTTLSAVAQLAVPQLADWCAIDLADEPLELYGPGQTASAKFDGPQTSNRLRRVAVAHSDPAKVELARRLEKAPVPGRDCPITRVFSSGKSSLIPEVSDSLLAASSGSEERLEILRAMGLKSAMIVPLVARRRALGLITLVSAESGRTYTQTDLEVAEDLAHRAALAVDNARLHGQAKEARAEAEAERERLKAVFEQAPAMSCVLLGPGHVFIMANPRFLQMFPGRMLLGRTIREAFPEIEGQGFVEVLDRAYQTGERFVGHEMLVRLDREGSGRLEDTYFNFVYEPLRDAGGAVTGIFVHAVEVTEQVRARERVEQLASAVAAERDRLQQVVDVLPEGIAIADAQGNIVLYNEAALAIWGQIPPDGGIDSYRTFGVSTPDGSNCVPEQMPLARSVLRGEVVRGEQMIVRNTSTGRDQPLLVHSAPLRNTSGAVLGGVAVFQDISAMKELERGKDDFLAAAAHDLKTPLTAIKGLAQLLKGRAQKMDEPERSRFIGGLSQIDESSTRMVSTINELLDVTRLQMGRPLDLERCQTDLVALAENVAAEQRHTSSRHEIVVNKRRPRVVGLWDAVRLGRAIANLVSNAIKYSPAGGTVTITVDQQEESALVAVHDNGIGISARDLPHIFERFYRAENGANRADGTGIGLTAVRHITEQHGGTVEVESEEGNGSTFTVRLPLVPPPIAQTKEAVEARR